MQAFRCCSISRKEVFEKRARELSENVKYHRRWCLIPRRAFLRDTTRERSIKKFLRHSWLEIPKWLVSWRPVRESNPCRRRERAVS